MLDLKTLKVGDWITAVSPRTGANYMVLYIDQHRKLVYVRAIDDERFSTVIEMLVQWEKAPKYKKAWVVVGAHTTSIMYSLTDLERKITEYENGRVEYRVNEILLELPNNCSMLLKE